MHRLKRNPVIIEEVLLVCFCVFVFISIMTFTIIAVKQDNKKREQVQELIFNNGKISHDIGIDIDSNPYDRSVYPAEYQVWWNGWFTAAKEQNEY